MTAGFESVRFLCVCVSKGSFFGHFAPFWYEMTKPFRFRLGFEEKGSTKKTTFGLTRYLGKSSLIKALTEAYSHVFLERIIKQVTVVVSFEERTRFPELLKSFCGDASSGLTAERCDEGTISARRPPPHHSVSHAQLRRRFTVFTHA